VSFTQEQASASKPARATKRKPLISLPPEVAGARIHSRREACRARPGGEPIHDPQVARRFAENPFLKALAAAYLAVWVATSVAPFDRSDWLLENLLVFAAAAVLVATHRVFVFSNFSYLLIAIFLALHAVGAHYTYSLAPFGGWISRSLGLARNPYDRLVHFAFGLLFAYPLHEVARRALHVHGGWSWTLPALALLALSSSYEIVESWTARIVDPALGQAFLGAQGDEWDAQKDMTLALTGAALALASSALYRARTGREPWLWLRRAGPPAH
jgi:putative membrane protein